MSKLNDLPLFTQAEKKAPQKTEPEVKVHSVSELNRQIKGLLEGKFPLMWIKGEISNFTAHSSGHYYFSLKDQKSQISAVMFRGHNRMLKMRPKNGLEVIIRGRVTVYEPRGNYQFFCETMEPVGAGALQQAFEKLKLKLRDEGLFEPERKKQLPTLPKHVALVTSPTGAAVKDMLNVLGRRFRGLDITVVPCKVQGEGSHRTVVHALEQVERLHKTQPVDVVICGRGGGSIEDLWAFNEEELARKIADFPLPIVSAVGHEIDFTIADFVADLRAPTPSAAAELVVQNAAELNDRLLRLKRQLWHLLQQTLKSKKAEVKNYESRLVDPKRYLQDLSIRCDDLVQRLESSMLRYFKHRRMQVSLAKGKLIRPDVRLKKEQDRVQHLSQSLKSLFAQKLKTSRLQLEKQQELLDSLSPLRVVDRGYSIVTKKKM